MLHGGGKKVAHVPSMLRRITLVLLAPAEELIRQPSGDRVALCFKFVGRRSIVLDGQASTVREILVVAVITLPECEQFARGTQLSVGIVGSAIYDFQRGQCA